MLLPAKALPRILLLALLFCMPATAGPIPMAMAKEKGGEAGVLKKGEVVDITADSMEVFEEENKTLFTGNVKTVKGDTTLYSDKLEVFMTTKKQKDGSEKDEVKELVATGNVRIVKPDMTITGKKAIINVKKDIATVIGDVVVQKPDATIQGQKLIANLKTNVTRVLAQGRKRVHGVFRQ